MPSVLNNDIEKICKDCEYNRMENSKIICNFSNVEKQPTDVCEQYDFSGTEFYCGA